MAQTYTPKELISYKGLFYEGINKKERQGCDRLFAECSTYFGGNHSVDDFIKQIYANLSAKRHNLAIISGQTPQDSLYSRNLRNIEIILGNIERSHPYVQMASRT